MTQILDCRVKKPLKMRVDKLPVGTWFLHMDHLYLKAGEDFVVDGPTGIGCDYSVAWAAEPVLIDIEIVGNRNVPEGVR